MASDVTNSHETGTATLVGDIIKDAQDLFKQQFQLFKVELREDVNKAKKAIPLACLALTMLLGGVFLLGLALGTLLHWAFGDPLWVWQAVAAVVWIGLGVAIFLVLLNSKSLHPIPEQSMEALKENVEWKTNPR